MIKALNKFSNILPQHETEALLSCLFKCTRRDLYTKDIPADRDVEDLFDSMVQRRLAGEPLQYITGCADFMGMDFMVEKGVFIPRPETGLLVNEVLCAIRYLPRTRAKRVVRGALCGNKRLTILDLCAGSGCIAVSLAKTIPGAGLTATDISERALCVARKNAVLHGVSERIRFYKGDLFEALVFDKNLKFDIIVCNPPYVKDSDIGFLQEEVRQEPEVALDGGHDGLKFYRRIAGLAPRYLKQGGSIFLEMGIGQANDVEGIFSSEGLYRLMSVKKDFAGIERMAWIGLL